LGQGCSGLRQAQAPRHVDELMSSRFVGGYKENKKILLARHLPAMLRNARRAG